MKCPACGQENFPGMDACEACMVSLSHEDIPIPQTDLQRRMLDPVSSLDLPPPECVPPHTSLAEAIVRMGERNVGCLLVTDGPGRLVGIFAEGDVFYKVAGRDRSLADTEVEHLMSPDPTALVESAPIGHVLHLMALHGFRHIPIVDGEGRPIEIASFRTILAFVGTLYALDTPA